MSLLYGCSLGTVGLAAIDASRIAGATRIIGIDNNSKKENLARHFGVTDFVNTSTLPENTTIQQRVLDMTNGAGELQN